MASSAIADGGVTVLEITMTVPGAIQVMRKLAEQRPDILIGAGTVLDPETARMCILEGAKFVVSPALNLKTIEMCHRYSIAVLPERSPRPRSSPHGRPERRRQSLPRKRNGRSRVPYRPQGTAPPNPHDPHRRCLPCHGKEFLEAGAFALGVGSDLSMQKPWPKENPRSSPTTPANISHVREFRESKK